MDPPPTCTFGLMGASASKGVLFIGRINGMTLIHEDSDDPKLGGIGAPYSNNCKWFLVSKETKGGASAVVAMSFCLF